MLTLPLAAHTVDINISDYLFAILFVMGVIVYSSYIKNKRQKLPNSEHYKYYMTNIYYKLFFSLVFGGIYLYYYGGGDTDAYYKGGQALQNLLFQSPYDYFTEMWNEPIGENIIIHYNKETGYPPGWIYRDPNSFFVSKIFSIVMLFTGQSYVVLTLVCGYVSALASWKIYELTLYYNVTTARFGAFATLFIPSVAFWCSGVSKDTVILIAVFYLLHHLFGLFNKTSSSRFYSFLMVIFLAYILFGTRVFMLFTVVAPLLVAMSTRALRKYRGNIFLSNIIRVGILSFALLGFLVFTRWQGEQIVQTANNYIQEAEVQQKDFKNNDSYGSNRYDLGVTDYSPFGMLRAAPLSIFIAIYRPGLWEANSPLLLISGLETFAFLVITFVFIFRGNVFKKIRVIRVNEFLVFCFFFVIILAFFAGFTSILFGVLVRIKAPLLPFLIILLATKASSYDEWIKKQELEESEMLS